MKPENLIEALTIVDQEYQKQRKISPTIYETKISNCEEKIAYFLCDGFSKKMRGMKSAKVTKIAVVTFEYEGGVDCVDRSVQLFDPEEFEFLFEGEFW